MSTTTLHSAAHGVKLRGGPITWLLRTDDAAAPLVARIALGAVMLPHGLQKLLGWFGGYGFEGTMGFLTGQVGLPWIVAFLVIMIESLGAVALIVGAAGRLAALGMVAVMTGAIATAHFPNGFFMNWTGQQAGEGFEYHILALALAAVVLVAGSGKASLDRALSR